MMTQPKDEKMFSLIFPEFLVNPIMKMDSY